MSGVGGHGSVVRCRCRVGQVVTGHEWVTSSLSDQTLKPTWDLGPGDLRAARNLGAAAGVTSQPGQTMSLDHESDHESNRESDLEHSHESNHESNPEPQTTSLTMNPTTSQSPVPPIAIQPSAIPLVPSWCHASNHLSRRCPIPPTRKNGRFPERKDLEKPAIV